MSEKLRINFVLPPAPNISGGPLAILEYANRFLERGHIVTVTTYPDAFWSGQNPFPWFDFKGKICFKRMRNSGLRDSCLSTAALQLLGRNDIRKAANAIVGNLGLEGLRQILLQAAEHLPERTTVEFLTYELLSSLHTTEVIPECDLNIATFWSTAFPVFFSRKGKPVYFMQHYEEILYPQQPAFILQRLAARTSYQLPLHKVANSSWLQRQIKQRFDQDVPFSNNGLVLSDFAPRPKISEMDDVIRVVTYTHHLDWKGFGDAVAAMAIVRRRYGSRVEWNVFGYRHPTLTEDNLYARYKYHPKLSFAELANLYATSDVVLCPSWYESFPLPPLEAMASGTAVVTTSDGTEDYAFHEQNALVVPSRGVEQMAAAVSRLIEDEHLRARLAGEGRKIAERFTWDRAVQERERILLGIHRGQLACDVWNPSNLGLVDGAGIEFERAPSDIQARESALFWQQNDLFLLHNGTKRHVAGADVIPLLVRSDLKYISLDHLAAIRTPTGPPIFTSADIPHDLGTSRVV